jgi:TetR/AcrR family transcriptional regulator, mexJK operon transcriptional repressor
MDKRAAIIRAAHQLFFKRGLESVKIEEIAACADVSKMTLYANFPDKVALFEAVVEQQSTRIEAAFARPQIDTGSIDNILTTFGITLLGFLLDPEIMRFDNILSAEMSRHPGLGHKFYEAGPNRMWQALTGIIKASVKKGEIRTSDAKRAAEDLIALWLGMVPLRHRFNALKPMSEAEIEERVTHGVAGFMMMYGSRA